MAALCLQCGAKSCEGFGAIKHKLWCIFYGTKKRK